MNIKWVIKIFLIVNKIRVLNLIDELNNYKCSVNTMRKMMRWRGKITMVVLLVNPIGSRYKECVYVFNMYIYVCCVYMRLYV